MPTRFELHWAGPLDLNADLDRRDVLRLGLLGAELTEQGVTGQVSTIDLSSFREATAVNCIAVYSRTQCVVGAPRSAPGRHAQGGLAREASRSDQHHLRDSS